MDKDLQPLCRPQRQPVCDSEARSEARSTNSIALGGQREEWLRAQALVLAASGFKARVRANMTFLLNLFDLSFFFCEMKMLMSVTHVKL